MEMNEIHRSTREDFHAPKLSGLAPEVIEYIEKLEIALHFMIMQNTANHNFWNQILLARYMEAKANLNHGE